MVGPWLHVQNFQSHSERQHTHPRETKSSKASSEVPDWRLCHKLGVDGWRKTSWRQLHTEISTGRWVSMCAATIQATSGASKTLRNTNCKRAVLGCANFWIDMPLHGIQTDHRISNWMQHMEELSCIFEFLGASAVQSPFPRSQCSGTCLRWCRGCDHAKKAVWRCLWAAQEWQLVLRFQWRVRQNVSKMG